MIEAMTPEVAHYWFGLGVLAIAAIVVLFILEKILLRLTMAWHRDHQAFFWEAFFWALLAGTIYILLRAGGFIR
jgi:hypothetical protein